MAPGVAHSAPGRSTHVKPNSINAHLEMPHTGASPLTQAAAGSRGERGRRRRLLPVKEDRRGVGGGVWVKRRRERREAGGKDNVHVSGSEAAEEDSGSPSRSQEGNDWKLSPCSP